MQIKTEELSFNSVKKRLRKKRRVGEFQEFGFGAGFRFSDLLTMEARNNLLNRFIEEAIEKNGLQFGGGFHALGDEPAARLLTELDQCRGQRSPRPARI